MTAVGFQPSLLDGATEVGVGALDGQVQRVELTHGAWIDLRPRWIHGADTLFERLHHRVPWHAERRPMYDRVVDVPRLLSFYDERHPLPDPALDEARSALDDHYATELGERFVTAGLCLYRNGDDSVAWHGDRIGRGNTHDTMVAIIVLGAPRALVLRPETRHHRPRRRRRQPGHPTLRARPRRPPGDGRQLPAHLGARGAEDRASDRPTDQRAVPPGGGSLADITR